MPGLVRSGPASRTVHEAHLSKYARLGDYHWREYAAGTTYARHAEAVRGWIREHRILDVGGGDGLITALLRADGREAEIVDADLLAVQLAIGHGMPAKRGTVYALPGGRWDAVLLGDVLEHLADPLMALRQLARVAPVLYIATPPKRPAGFADPFHLQEFTIPELIAIAGRAGWAFDTAMIDHGRIRARFTRSPWWQRWRMRIT